MSGADVRKRRAHSHLLLPELTEVVEGEVGNVEGVTSAVSSVHVVGEEAPLGLSAAEAVGAGVDTFHLVVHYAVVRELRRAKRGSRE